MKITLPIVLCFFIALFFWGKASKQASSATVLPQRSVVVENFSNHTPPAPKGDPSSEPDLDRLTVFSPRYNVTTLPTTKRYTLIKAPRLKFDHSTLVEISLNFVLPVFDQETESVFVSKNGSVYFKNPKIRFSQENIRSNYLDVLHVKLRYPTQRFGVRVKHGEDNLRIQWYGVKRGKKMNSIFAETTLYRDGVIEARYRVEDLLLAKILNKNPIKLKGTDYSTLVKYSGLPPQKNLIRFHPSKKAVSTDLKFL